MKLAELRGLGVKSAAILNKVGVYNKEDLDELGAVATYIKLYAVMQHKPSLNFLYALVGAIEDRDWRDVAKQDREDLLAQLAAYDDWKRSAED